MLVASANYFHRGVEFAINKFKNELTHIMGIDYCIVGGFCQTDHVVYTHNDILLIKAGPRERPYYINSWFLKGTKRNYGVWGFQESFMSPVVWYSISLWRVGHINPTWRIFFLVASWGNDHHKFLHENFLKYFQFPKNEGPFLKLDLTTWNTFHHLWLDTWQPSLLIIISSPLSCELGLLVMGMILSLLNVPKLHIKAPWAW